MQEMVCRYFCNVMRKMNVDTKGKECPAQTNVQNALGETPLLLSWHSWCNTDKNSLFCPPAKISVESIVELLLQYGADTNIASKTGERPLHLAARFGHPKLCQRLLNFRANPHQKSSGKDGITPINLAKKVNKLPKKAAKLKRS